MAAITLKAYNTVTLTANTAQQLLMPDAGHYYVQILNIGPGNLYIKNDGTVASTDPASFELPMNLSITPYLAGGIWIAADAAGKASVALIPRN